MSNITGTDGDDSLRGTRREDTITGGAGDDVLRGGAGNDTFVFARGDGRDVIRDFQAGDVILLDGGRNTISYHETEKGWEIWSGGFAGQAADHDVIRLPGVFDLALVVAAVQFDGQVFA